MNLRSIFVSATFAASSVGLVFFLTRGSSEATVDSAVRPAAPEAGTASAVQGAPTPGADRGAAAGLSALVVVPDAPLEEYRKSLLDLAGLAATAIPSMPHIKTRSREQ